MIEINNLTTVKIDEDFLKRVAKKVLKGENKEGAGLSVALVGEGRIKELNKKYRRKNRVTDVLAFNGNSKFKIQNLKFNFGLGEIVICLAEVKKNAKKFNTTFKEELVRVLIHGILHLLGYKHEKSKEQVKVMERKQEQYLKQVF